MFMFDLEVDDLTDDDARAIAAACEAEGAWPVAFVPGRVERRWFGIEKAYPAVLEIQSTDASGSILAPTAERDAQVIDLRADAVDRLARTIEILGAHFPDGFGLIATYSGSPIQTDRALSVSEAAELIRAPGLNEFTRYRVSG